MIEASFAAHDLIVLIVDRHSNKETIASDASTEAMNGNVLALLTNRDFVYIQKDEKEKH
jgi:hypothetical protein